MFITGRRVAGPGRSTLEPGVRAQFHDNMISGIAMHLAGPQSLRLVFQAFVVIVGFLILSGGVNTAIVGSKPLRPNSPFDRILSPAPGLFV